MKKKEAPAQAFVDGVLTVGGEPLVEVRKSPIHGRGVFARRTIAAGTPILEYLGERIDDAEARVRYAETTGKKVTYLLRVDARTSIDGAVGGSAARFVNHGCLPSCELLLHKKRVFLITRRRVRPEEELTFDYHLVVRGDVDLETARRAAPCKCGARRCRGTMLNDDRPVRR